MINGLGVLTLLQGKGMSNAKGRKNNSFISVLTEIKEYV
jgi:hypothetical protein